MMHGYARFFCAWVYCALLIPGAVANAAGVFLDAEASVGQVIGTLRERLDLMEQVAAWKDTRGLPIEVAVRERAVLDASVSAASRLGIEPQSVRALFETQIRLARQAQQAWMDRWRSGARRPLMQRDLDSDLRPALDRLGERLLVEIYLAMPELRRADFMARYRAQAARLISVGITPDDAQQLLAALGLVRASAGPLMPKIGASGVLRVGTTGDYAPFSLEREGSLSGVDIELAQGLAHTLQARVVFVRTTWPTLMDDFTAGRFDLAMSGISITPERRAVAAFSRSYHQGGKTAIVRCGREAAFDTLAEIDRPAVRAIVNPGGTNERFARAELRHAQLIVHPDNRTVFDEIVLGRADVMVTDDVEVELQTRQRPELCRATQSLFSHADKAFLLPREPAFVAEVDRWLGLQIEQGQVGRLLDEAFGR